MDLTIQSLPQATLQNLDDGSKRILAFMCTRSWALAQPGTQGITWLELAIMYFLYGGSEMELGLPVKYIVLQQNVLEQIVLE